MKRLLKLCPLSLFVLIVFASCPNPSTPENPYTYEAKTEVGKLYRMLMNRQIDSVTKSVEKILEYDYDGILKEKWSNPMELNKIYETIDFDTIKQTSSSGTQIVLGDEMEEIANTFLAYINSMKPDLSFLLEYEVIDGYTIEVVDDVVLLEEDMIIDTSSPWGIISIEMIKAHLAGEDMYAIVVDLDNIARAYNQKRNENNTYYSPFYIDDVFYWDSDTLTVKINEGEFKMYYIRFLGV